MKQYLLRTAHGAILAIVLYTHAHAADGLRLVEFARPIPAPAFELEELISRELRTLEGLAGQHVLLNFWATWCTPCLREMPSLEQLQQRFKSRDFKVVAISLDEEGWEQVTPFVDDLKLTFTILLDSENTVSAAYGANALPSTFVLDPQGQVIAAARGDRDWFSAEAIAWFDKKLP